MNYVGFCPVCGTGPLGIRICGGQGDAVILCDECDAVWLEPQCGELPFFPEQPDLPCPLCAGTLRHEPAHWASHEEVDRLGWQHAVIGEGEALGEE